MNLLAECDRRNIRIEANGETLKVDAPKGALSPDLVALLKEHKPDLLASLSGKINRWRVTHADGRVTEHSSRRLTESEALALSLAFGEPVKAEPIIRDAAPSPPGNLDGLLTEACQGVEGSDAATFRALLSPEDVQNSEGGSIPMVTLNAYARSFAEGIRTGRIAVLAAAAPHAPRTSRVRCADCQHFERDSVGDGNGIGCCRVQGEGTGLGQPALWPRVDRACRDFTE